jgi:hypothetical protein
MKDAPTADINEWGVLLCLAEAADEDGCNAFPSVKTMASYAKVSPRTVQRALGAMEDRKLIAEGDQRAAMYIPEHRRPTVYDLLIPYGWFRDIERTNAFRVRLGRSPLTPADRPPIAPAPPKKTRADKGKPKPKKDAAEPSPESESGGRLEVTPVENSPEDGGRLVVTPVENGPEGATTSQGVTASRERGDYKSEGGRLEVTQPSPTTRTTDSPRPSVGATPAAQAPGDGGTDGSSPDIRTQKKQARTVERTPGVDLLLGLGYERPELLLTGKVLEDQGRMVDGLLLGGHDRDLILTTLLRPLPQNTRSVGAVISKRLLDLAATPVPRRMTMPAPRDGRWERPDETGTWTPERMMGGEEVELRRSKYADCAECRDPIITFTGTDRCVNCEGWPKCPLCDRSVAPNAVCDTCQVSPGEVEVDVCELHKRRYVAGTACFDCVAPQ